MSDPKPFSTPVSSTLKMEAVYRTEKSVIFIAPHGIRALKAVTSSCRCDESYFNPVQAEMPVHSFGYLPFPAKSLAQEV